MNISGGGVTVNMSIAEIKAYYFNQLGAAAFIYSNNPPAPVKKTIAARLYQVFQF